MIDSGDDRSEGRLSLQRGRRGWQEILEEVIKEYESLIRNPNHPYLLYLRGLRDRGSVSGETLQSR